METDLSSALMAARTAATRQTAQLAMVRQSHEMEQALVKMVTEVARAAPSEGQGKSVDKLA
jgi:hypothetical protein